MHKSNFTENLNKNGKLQCMQTNSEVKKIRGCPQVSVICDKDRHVAFVVLATKCFLKFSYEPDRYM